MVGSLDAIFADLEQREFHLETMDAESEDVYIAKQIDESISLGHESILEGEFIRSREVH